MLEAQEYQQIVFEVLVYLGLSFLQISKSIFSDQAWQRMEMLLWQRL